MMGLAFGGIIIINIIIVSYTFTIINIKHCCCCCSAFLLLHFIFHIIITTTMHFDIFIIVGNGKNAEVRILARGVEYILITLWELTETTDRLNEL